MQVYSRLNHVCVSVSYNATLKLVEDICQLFTLPLQKWIADNVIFKFWGDNLAHKRGVRDERSDNQGLMVYMYSMLVGRSRTPAVELSCKCQVAPLESLPSDVSFPLHLMFKL